MRRGYFTPPVLIILAIIIFAVAILIAINTDLVKRIKKEPSSISSPSPTTQQSTQTQDETDRPPTLYPGRITMTADKKIYTHDGYSFSFQFPKEWVVVSDSLPESPTERGGYGGTLEIGDISTTEKPSLAVRVDTAYGIAEADIEYTLSPTSDGGWEVTGRKLVPPRNSPVEVEPPHQNDGIIIIRAVRTVESHQYWIDFSFTEGGKDYEPVFKEILSTFQFID
ncbi:MAG TPA: hypothetical protein VJ065_03360 [Patescibacteria group bacterium]|nr:hypothetical protein [Patescibacteria group bacterium]